MTVLSSDCAEHWKDAADSSLDEEIYMCCSQMAMLHQESTLFVACYDHDVDGIRDFVSICMELIGLLQSGADPCVYIIRAT